MALWMPRRILFEERALDYPMGRDMMARWRDRVETRVIGSHNRVTGLPGKTPREQYAEAKRTLVVGVRKTLDFETSRPSADYAIPLLTGCPGHCEYCYLQTTLGPRPYVRVYVNLDEIYARARAYMDARAPDLTHFEAACTSDPLAVEHITGAMAAAIRFFAAQPHGRLRFVSKYDHVEGLLDLDHRGHTRIRFSLNAADVIRRWELATASLAERLAAAVRVAEAGYPVGFIIAPIFLEGAWEQEYGALLDQVRAALAGAAFDPVRAGLTFELITHRYTPKARALITERFPATTLPMAGEERKWKFGQFGYGKYIYPAGPLAGAEAFFREQIGRLFPEARIQYLI